MLTRDASYVMCTALYMMVLYDRARVGPTTKTSDEISIICLFRLILQANPLFLFRVVVFELLQCQVLIPYLPQIVFSYSDVNTNPSRSSSFSFQFLFTGMFLFKWIRSLQHSQDQLSVLLNVFCFIHLQVAFVFPTFPPLIFFKDLDFLIEYPSYRCEVSPFFSFNVLIR